MSREFLSIIILKITCYCNKDRCGVKININDSNNWIVKLARRAHFDFLVIDVQLRANMDRISSFI